VNFPAIHSVRHIRVAYMYPSLSQKL